MVLKKEDLTVEQKEIFSIVNKITGDLCLTYNEYFEQLVNYPHVVHCMQNTSMAFFMSRMEQISDGFTRKDKRDQFLDKVKQDLFMSIELLKMQGVRYDG